MSYLNELRLHFAGRFQASVSTVNNDPAHYHNAGFQPSYQEWGAGATNGWWNPQGDAVWRLLGCQITSAWTNDGQVANADPVLGCSIADSNTRAPAKLLDLDSEQQLVSEIWGLQVRIVTADGTTLLTGDFEPAAFMDIWTRAQGKGEDVNACAIYQSVLSNLQWADVSSSPFLAALRAAASDGWLSIKFNVDGYSMDRESADFLTGRIVGTIGPATRDEPRHLVLGRQFMAVDGQGQGFFTPAGKLNFCVGRVDAAASCIYLDLGNALPTMSPGGPAVNLGPLTLSCYDPTSTPGQPAGSAVTIGTISEEYATSDRWYAQTAGIVRMPIAPALLSRVQSAPLALTGNAGVQIQEWSNGAFVRADRFVYRMSPGDKVQVSLYATRFGGALRETALQIAFDPSGLQGGDGAPPVAVPQAALQYSTSVTTDNQGRAQLTVTASDPGMPRSFNGDYGIDGQVYGLRASFSDAAVSGGGPDDPWSFISFLVWSDFKCKVPKAPTWYDDLQPVFQQYGNLYPIMKRFVDLTDYESAASIPSPRTPGSRAILRGPRRRSPTTTSTTPTPACSACCTSYSTARPAARR